MRFVILLLCLFGLSCSQKLTYNEQYVDAEYLCSALHNNGLFEFDSAVNAGAGTPLHEYHKHLLLETVTTDFKISLKLENGTLVFSKQGKDALVEILEMFTAIDKDRLSISANPKYETYADTWGNVKLVKQYYAYVTHVNQRVATEYGPAGAALQRKSHMYMDCSKQKDGSYLLTSLDINLAGVDCISRC